MVKENVKPNINEYEFLLLLVSVKILQGKTPIFANEELQKKLYSFYDSPEFKFLFEDICKKESIDGNNYVNLDTAFQKAYALGLLLPIQGGKSLKSLVICLRAEAEYIVSNFTKEVVDAMSNLSSKVELSHDFPNEQINKTKQLLK